MKTIAPEEIDLMASWKNGNRPAGVIRITNGRLILDPKRIRPFSDQPRKYFNPASMEQLKRSIRHAGQKEPIKVILISNSREHDFELVDGERRLRSCLELGISIHAILDNIQSRSDQFLDSLVSNLAREGHEHLEIANALAKIKIEKSLRAEEIADLVGRSLPWVYQYLSLLKLPPEVKEMMDPSLLKENQLGMSAALEILKLPAELQIITAKEIVGRRMRISQARQHIVKVAGDRQIPLSGQQPRPVTLYKILDRLLDNFRNKISGFSQMSEEAVYAFFKDRQNPLDDINNCLELVTITHGKINSLYKTLRKVRTHAELQNILGRRKLRSKK